MDFHILGRLEVLDEGRGSVAVTGSKQRALLALLLLHGNETLSTSRLIDELWGEEPPATAAKAVQVHVSRLRKSLAAGADGNGSAGLVLTREHGYELRLDPERLDAARFERLLAEGRSELARSGLPAPMSRSSTSRCRRRIPTRGCSRPTRSVSHTPVSACSCCRTISSRSTRCGCSRSTPIGRAGPPTARRGRLQESPGTQ